MENHEVIIIGAGPSGLSAALRLKERGFKDLVVLERETEAGGVPRHCGHFGFGWESHKRLMTGPNYAKRLVRDAQGIDIRTATTVLELTLRNTLRVHSVKGISEMTARHIIMATGTRESSRAMRLIGGNRLKGVMNTGTLQQMTERPFERPAIIGHEWVTYSALMTCKHLSIKPVGIFSEEELDTPWFFPLGAKMRYGVPTHLKTKLIAIHGSTQVETIEIEREGVKSLIECDGVILTGEFVPELSLLTRSTAPLRPATLSTSPTRGEDEGSHAPPIVGELREAVRRALIIGNARGTVHTAGRCVVEARAAMDLLS
jgi:thioredoxin reductase